MSEQAPETTPPAAEPQATPAPPQAEPAAPEPQAQPPASGQEPPAAEPDSVEKLPAWAQKLIRDNRTESATYRTKAKETADALSALKDTSQKQLDGIAKALGLKPEEATPEQILAERDAASTRAAASDALARQSKVELAVFRAAAAAEANGNALLDSRSFVATLDGLDPSAADFGEQVSAKITAALESNPAFRAAAPAAPPLAAATAPAAPAVPRSSAEFGSAPTGPRQWTDADVTAASPAEVEQAMNDGLLKNLGFGTARKDRRFG